MLGVNNQLGSIGTQAPHISVNVKPVQGSTEFPVEFFADVSKSSSLGELAEVLRQAAGLPANGVLFMYEGRTLDLAKSLDENDVTLPGPAARRRGDRVGLSFDTVEEVVSEQREKDKQQELDRERLIRKKEQDRKKLIEEEEKKETLMQNEQAKLARSHNGQAEIDVDKWVATKLGVAQQEQIAKLQDRDQMEAWSAAGYVSVNNHHLTRCSNEVETGMQQLMRDNGLMNKVVRVYCNENETLRRRYERAKGLLINGGGIIKHEIRMQSCGVGAAPIDFLGSYEPDVNEYPMWHGTPAAVAAGGICSSGFDIAFAGARGLAWGHGFYFADSAGTSAGYAGTERINSEYANCGVMLLCRVLAGNIKHLSSAPTPEQKETFTGECLGSGGTFGAKSAFHSICGGQWAYVCAHRDQVYPAYVIVYRT